MARLDPAYAAAAEIVRRDDPDGFFASLFYPADARPHVHAVMAFGREVARIPDLVSEPMLGEVRLQWWRDAIERGEAAGHPIAEAFLATVARLNLDTSAFLALLEARAFDLYRDPMPSDAALAGYVHNTSVTLFEAIARCLVPGRLPPASVAAAGRAHGRTMLLCGLPRQVMRGCLYLPLDLLARYRLPPEHVLARRSSPALGLVLGTMRATVRAELATMHGGLAVPDPAAPTCLPAFLCELYLRAMERPPLDPFLRQVEIARWRRQWHLWRAARRLPEP